MTSLKSPLIINGLSYIYLNERKKLLIFNSFAIWGKKYQIKKLFHVGRHLKKSVWIENFSWVCSKIQCYHTKYETLEDDLTLIKYNGLKVEIDSQP